MLSNTNSEKISKQVDKVVTLDDTSIINNK